MKSNLIRGVILKSVSVFLGLAGSVIADVQVTANGAPTLQGAPNFRDIGGYLTTGGRHVRRGEVFRSGELSQLTPADAVTLDSLHVATVVDLRTEDERRLSPSAWLHAPSNLYESPKDSLTPVMREILRNAGTAAGARRGLMKLYAHMPDNYRAEYAAMFHRIAAGDLPILVHCTAGKDRTGVAMALLLTSIGVPRRTVIKDYAMTDKYLRAPDADAVRQIPVGGAAQALAAAMKLPDESRRALWQADPNYIQAALDSIGREYGSIDGYLERALGLSRTEIQRIREVMVE
jgi:protein-tyrosine phosphatase